MLLLQAIRALLELLGLGLLDELGAAAWRALEDLAELPDLALEIARFMVAG